LGKQSFDRKLEEIAALRSAAEETALPRLRKALSDRGNYVVAKAASIAGERQFHPLEPELLAAFERFMKDPAKSDPQCWAKNAIAKALKDLAHADPAVFFRGVAYVQLEGTWGGSEDTAATLRGTCALALIGTTAASFDILTRLTDLLNDPEKTVRSDAARAMAQLSAREGLLPLRLKALVGDREPEVVGYCLAALLSLAPREYLPFVAGFLRNKDPDLRLEAAGVLAESREPEAVDSLKQFWETQTDPEVKRAVITFLAGSPLPAAAEFLLSVAEEAAGQIAAEALVALSKSRYHLQFQERIAAIVGRKLK
jgi:HEAT repeat protein